MAEAAHAAAARQRLEQALAALPPRLAAEWADLQVALGLWGGEDRPPYFLHPMALPVLQLPDWLSQSLPPEGRAEGAAATAGASAMAGYLHVRIRDDAFDLGEPARPGRLLLSDRLLQLHLSLLVEAGGPGMLSPATGLWTSFSEAMLEEAAARASGRAHDAALFQQLLHRSRPMELPALAVLPHGAEDPRAADLSAFVDALVHGHQLLNDLVDLEADQAAGLPTWLQTRAAASDAAGLARWLLLSGGLDAVASEVAASLDRAQQAADRLGMHGARPWLRERRSLVDRVRLQTQTAALRRLLGAGGGATKPAGQPAPYPLPAQAPIGVLDPRHLAKGGPHVAESQRQGSALRARRRRSRIPQAAPG